MVVMLEGVWESESIIRSSASGRTADGSAIGRGLLAAASVLGTGWESQEQQVSRAIAIVSSTA